MTTSLTQTLAQDVASYHFDQLPAAALTFAKHSVLDWFGVGIAGASEPLSQMLVDELGNETASHTIIGHERRAGLIDSAMINGATSHALDFDDTVMSMMGHASVSILPAVLSLAECTKVTGCDILTAFTAGFDTACRIGRLAQPSHYDIGFHNTGTLGTFGAAAATARLLCLDAHQTSHALGLAAAQAAGLKSSFGSMAKPLQAGKAASNGLLAARLAARGFTSNPEGLETVQGFLATQTRCKDTTLPAFVPGAEIQENLFKYHASCYFTHSPIEALHCLRETHQLSSKNVEAITLNVPEGHLSVCNIQDPTTGLEAKFSLRHCAALVLNGFNTSSLETFTDANTHNPAVSQIRSLVDVRGGYPHTTEAEVTVVTTSGDVFVQTSNVGVPESDLSRQEQRLSDKFNALVSPLLGSATCEELKNTILSLDKAKNISSILTTVRKPAP